MLFQMGIKFLVVEYVFELLIIDIISWSLLHGV